MPSETIQNIDNKDTILQMLNSNKALKTDSDKCEFSNLFNNISAKTQKMQTKFIDKAVKSNTSSINRFVIKEKPTNNKTIEKADLKKQYNSNIQSDEKISTKDDTTNEQAVSNENEKDTNEQTSELNKSQNPSTEPSQKLSQKLSKEFINERSDSLKDSEPSPDFSLEEEKDEKEEEQLPDTAQNVLLTLDIDLSQKDEITTSKIDEIQSDIENMQDIINSIEEISDDTANSDFADENKDEKGDETKDIQDKPKQNETDFKNTLSEPETSEDNKILDEQKPIENNQTKPTKENSEQKTDNTQQDAIKEVENTLQTNDTQKLPEVLDKLNKALAALSKSSQTSQNKDINLDKKLTKELDKLNKILSSKYNSDIELQDDENAQDIDIELKPTYDTKPKEKLNIEETLKKFTNLQEKIQKLSYEEIETPAGALTVADEVAKLALEQENNLNSIQGSVIYDSASGNGALIKNASLLLKTAQMGQNIENSNSEIEKSGILNQIGSKLQDLKNGSQKLTVVLRPLDLGRLSIELTNNKNGLTTNIIAQNENVRQYIEKNINNLRQQLTDSGINVNSIEIKTQGQNNSSFYDGNQNPYKDDPDQNQQNQQNQKHQQYQQGQKNQKDELFTMSNYDMQYNKDFSSILNKSLNYSLN